MAVPPDGEGAGVVSGAHVRIIYTRRPGHESEETYSRVPEVGELVEARAPLAERPIFTIWEVRRVVHHPAATRALHNYDATICVETEDT